MLALANEFTLQQQIMTWHETIAFIRSEPGFESLVESAYLDSDLMRNVNRYAESAEFKEILKKLDSYQNTRNKVLDIGSGNGISAVSFAKVGYEVTALEPDPSDTIGAGAISYLKETLGLKNLSVIQATAEDFSSQTKFDIIFARQALHHASDLDAFVSNCCKHLKPGGLFVTVRDHVISKEEDLPAFLDSHPLQQFYGGEYAYTLSRYKSAFQSSGLVIMEELSPMSTVINFHPRTEEDISNLVIGALRSKGLGFLAGIPRIHNWTRSYLDEKDQTPGRLYSFIATKKQPQ